ncbi:PEP-CTERM sorting domain-containing protein [Nitrosomonas ureae]|nr:PEP-CTERM sorting domain-containing protein [Nitrosomonas ureae]
MLNIKHKYIINIGILILIGWANLIQAATHLITFEEPGISAMENSYIPVPSGARLDNLFLSTLGVSFSSGVGYAAVVDHGAPSFLTPSSPNVLGGTTASGILDYSAPIIISFFDPSQIAQKATTNFVKVLGDFAGLGSGTITMTAYDSFGTILGSITDTDNKPFGQGPVLALHLNGIHSIVLSGSSNTVGFDNLEFNTPLLPVPEPETYTMLLAGLGLLGFLARCREFICI